MSEQYIGHFIHLKTKPKANEALSILQRVANHVAPILRDRKWRVKTLAEFFPTQTNLLGTNYGKGVKISLRLRPHYHDGEFLSFEDIMGTMLHELAHNTFGPHDAKFYALLDELNLEYDTLLVKGFTGNDGVTLGGRNMSIADARKAATTRAIVLSRGTGLTGKKLGGPSTSTSVAKDDLKQKVAEAAQRRAFDAKWCGHGRAEEPVLIDSEEENVNDGVIICPTTHEDNFPRKERFSILRQGEAGSLQFNEKEKDKSIMSRQDVETIEIISDDEPETIEQMDRAPTPPKQRDTRAAAKRKLDRVDEDSDDYQRMKSRGLLADSLYDHLKKLRTKPHPKETSGERNDEYLPPGTWRCALCTLLNPLRIVTCEACNTERSIDGKREGYWHCDRCGAFTEKSAWMCRTCQSIKTTS